MRPVVSVLVLCLLTGCVDYEFHAQGNPDLTVRRANSLCGKAMFADHPPHVTPLIAFGAIGGALNAAADDENAARSAEWKQCMLSHGWAENP